MLLLLLPIIISLDVVQDRTYEFDLPGSTTLTFSGHDGIGTLESVTWEYTLGTETYAGGTNTGSVPGVFTVDRDASPLHVDGQFIPWIDMWYSDPIAPGGWWLHTIGGGFGVTETPTELARYLEPEVTVQIADIGTWIVDCPDCDTHTSGTDLEIDYGWVTLTYDVSFGYDDLMAVMAAWGGASPGMAEDINGDGEVGYEDLCLVLSNWSP